MWRELLRGCPPPYTHPRPMGVLLSLPTVQNSKLLGPPVHVIVYRERTDTKLTSTIETLGCLELKLGSLQCGDGVGGLVEQNSGWYQAVHPKKGRCGGCLKVACQCAPPTQPTNLVFERHTAILEKGQRQRWMTKKRQEQGSRGTTIQVMTLGSL
jgi:hypothetical protein